jgi:predicted transposase YbfD/YdcC
VLQDLDGDALERAFRRHAAALLPPGEPGQMPVIALDGKTLKGSFDHLNDRKAAQALSAFASEAARDSGNALLAQVKANQPGLLATLEDVAATQPPADRCESVDAKGHGRHETRTVETYDVQGRLDAEWGGLIVTGARVTRLTWHKDTKSGFWHATEEVSFYACQVALGAEAFGAAVRSHWGIENRSHYVRDVTFGEDKSRTRIKPAHFARFRSFALNILRANGVQNVAQELYINALNFDNALTYRASKRELNTHSEN